MFLEISQNLHLCQTLFFLKKETLALVFYCEICEIFKNIFFYRTPLDDWFWSMAIEYGWHPSAFTQLAFLIHLKTLYNSQVSVFSFEDFFEFYTSRFLLKLGYRFATVLISLQFPIFRDVCCCSIATVGKATKVTVP